MWKRRQLSTEMGFFEDKGRRLSSLERVAFYFLRYFLTSPGLPGCPGLPLPQSIAVEFDAVVVRQMSIIGANHDYRDSPTDPPPQPHRRPTEAQQTHRNPTSRQPYSPTDPPPQPDSPSPTAPKTPGFSFVNIYKNRIKIPYIYS